MWVMMNNAFLSIVDKDCGPGELLVRARRQGDIERVFPEAKVVRKTGTDYLFRAVISRSDVANAMFDAAYTIDYPNFKNSVRDDRLHRAYSRVWGVMSDLQPVPPYSDSRRRKLPYKPSPAAQARQAQLWGDE